MRGLKSFGGGMIAGWLNPPGIKQAGWPALKKEASANGERFSL